MASKLKHEPDWTIIGMVWDEMEPYTFHASVTAASAIDAVTGLMERHEIAEIIAEKAGISVAEAQAVTRALKKLALDKCKVKKLAEVVSRIEGLGEDEEAIRRFLSALGPNATWGTC